jgi:hypothetical protein
MRRTSVTLGFDDADISLHYLRVMEQIPLTLTNIISANPHLFYAQTWYNGEAFMEREATLIETPAFSQWSFPYLFPQQQSQRVSAASLAWAYVRDPNAEIWDKYLWTDDQDSQAQRVYVGGKSNTGRFEIHRHISISSRFGLPVFA